jgi:dTDP-4-dehydrorhamnose 3,5-epimerase
MGSVVNLLEGVNVHKLNVINNPKGNIYHILKKNQLQNMEIGEIYISEIFYNEVKGWKKHSEMILNLFVPVGNIKFVIFDDRADSKTFGNYMEIIIGQSNYSRLVIPSGVFVSFKGLDSSKNILINVASIEHNPSEAVTLELSQFDYKWD